MMTDSFRTPGFTNANGTLGEEKLQAIRVEVLSSPGKADSCIAERGTVVVGSDATCDLVLTDPKVSRRHVSVEVLPGAVRVRDLNSRNGTMYLGARIAEGRVPVGGTITIGKTTLRFAPADVPEVPLSERSELNGLIGTSRSMRQLFRIIERLGPSSSTALIRGETGAGKDAVARAIHSLSPQANGPFIIYDCASANPNLIESELFGHTRGAFTHATSDRVGALELANGGTIFFDEIGDLPMELQPKLLRALESREFRPVGSHVTRQMNARVLAATHKNLDASVAAGTFRADLYFRLAVTTVDVPPLRERPEDIPLLALHFARECGGAKATLAPSMLAALQCESWRGNVRELRNTVERWITLGQAQDRTVTPQRTNFKRAREWLVEQFERQYLTDVLAAHGGNVSAAARESGLSRSQFYRLLWQYGLTDKDGAGEET